MDWMEIIYKVCELFVFPLLIAITAYLVKLINSKAEEIKAKHENEMLNKYIDILNEVISECVIATTQTYVDEMKNNHSFGLEESKKALSMTYNNVINILNEKTKKYLNEALGDLEGYIVQKIESQIYLNKAEFSE